MLMPFVGASEMKFPLILGQKKSLLFSHHQSVQMKEVVNIFHQTESLCLWTSITAKEIDQTLTDDQTSKHNLRGWL